MGCCCSNSGSGVREDMWVFGTMFSSTDSYENPLLTGRFRLKMRGIEALIRKTEWDYLPNGGFKIFITPGWSVTPDVKIAVEFY